MLFVVDGVAVVGRRCLLLFAVVWWSMFAVRCWLCVVWCVVVCVAGDGADVGVLLCGVVVAVAVLGVLCVVVVVCLCVRCLVVAAVCYWWCAVW